MIPIINPSNPAYWELPLRSFNLGGIPAGTSPYNEESAVIDSANSFITMEIETARALLGSAEGAFPMHYITAVPPPGSLFSYLPYVGSLEAWAFPCQRVPDVSFTLGAGADAVSFGISPLDLNVGQIPANLGYFIDVPNSDALDRANKGSTPFCLASIIGMPGDLLIDGPSKIMLGKPFLKSWYTVLSAAEPPSVGLAATVLAVPETADHGTSHAGASTSAGEEGTIGTG